MRLSLRALIVLVLLLGALVGWVVRSARVQRDAVAAIQRAGGTVDYEWDLKNLQRVPNGAPPWPKWLVRLVGVDYFGNVVAVYLPNRCSDQELAHIGKLPRLEWLQISRGDITDRGLENMKGLTGLKVLIIQRTKTTDAGFAHMKNLTAVEVLRIDTSQCTDAGLQHFRGMAHLKVLGIANTKASIAEVCRLPAADGLKEIMLGNKAISDSDLVLLSRLKGLKQIGVRRTMVAKDDIPTLKQRFPDLATGRIPNPMPSGGAERLKLTHLGPF
jgi:hypothetical protein